MPVSEREAGSEFVSEDVDEALSIPVTPAHDAGSGTEEGAPILEEGAPILEVVVFNVVSRKFNATSPELKEAGDGIL